MDTINTSYGRMLMQSIITTLFFYLNKYIELDLEIHIYYIIFILLSSQ